MDPIESYLDIGVCCFCNNECNAMSQSCGSCSRQLSMSGFSSQNDMEETSDDEENDNSQSIETDENGGESPPKTEFDETRPNN